MMNTEIASSPRAGRADTRVSPEDKILRRMEALTYHGAVDFDGPAPATVRRWLVRHSLEDLLMGVDKSFSIHIRVDESGEVDPASMKKAFHKVPSLTETIIKERDRPWLGKLLYIQGVIRNKLGVKSHKCLDYLEDLHVSHGYALDRLESKAKAMPDWDVQQQSLDEWYAEFEGAL